MKNKLEKPKKQNNLWHCNPAEFALEKTHSSIEGLSNNEASKRLEKYGKNILKQKKQKNVLQLFLEELVNPIVLVLIVAMIFSFVVGEILDAFVILAIILIDAVIGTIQSKKAQNIARSLSNMVQVKTKVLRNGMKVEISAENLTIGDIVYLESGDKVSADMRILDCKNFTIDEALLTGESMNAQKSIESVKENASLGDQSNMVFSGSSVITGRAVCVVVEVGQNTQIGQIATSLNNIKDEDTPLTLRINKFSKQITIFIIAFSVLLFAIMALKHNPLKDIFLCVIALAVSAMPEGLPLAVTMALTIASNKMGKANVVVKNLQAVESLGSCTAIATDKTGTLTLNEQTAKIITLPGGESFDISGSGYNFNGIIKTYDESSKKEIDEIAELGMINNEATLTKNGEDYTYFGDSIDVAFLALAGKANVNTNNYNIISRIPYESENKYSAVFFKKNDTLSCTIKGSVETVLDFSSTMLKSGKVVEINKKDIIAQNENLAKMGYRVIALAVGNVEQQERYTSSSIKNLTFIGLVGFIDPVRPESKQAIKNCHKAGIKVLMITGDHPLTAFSIAKDVEIATDESQIATAQEVAAAYSKGEKAFDRFLIGKTVFSRVTPLDKLHIVESLKRQGEFVAVTGDGVNDSPAIKSAHIGIAMGSGTDVAKETADMIILDDNFNSIVSGIKEGRNAYSNIRKITYFLISCSFAEILFFTLSILFNTPTPLTAIQLLWLNVITDGLQDIALSLEKAEPNILNQKPRPTNESLFNKSMIRQCLLVGTYIGLFVFGLWWILTEVKHYDELVSRSFVMALMVFLQNWHAFNCRSESESLFKINFFSNPFFLFAVLGSIGLQILFMEVESLSELLELTSVSYLSLVYILLASLSILVVVEIYKLILKSSQKQK